MSPHAQTSFVNDLVVMAKAYEELPQVREQLADCRSQLAAAQAHVQRLELKLIDRANEVQEHLTIIRKLEEERDDAIRTFLEADERTSRALDFIKATFGNAGALIQALEPQKPEPMPEPKAEPVPQEPAPLPLSETGLNVSHSPAQSPAPEAHSTGSSEQNVESGSPFVSTMNEEAKEPPIVTSVGAEATTNAPSGEGQSEVPPPATQAPAPDTTANSQAGVQSGPYANKRYHDHPYYVTLQGWLAGGGTEESYNWRPGAYAG